MALIQKSGGGTGFSFSRLRPEGSIVKETHGVASGPVSFMRVFDTATGAIKEGGTRRGANMGILRVDHPDILKFITAKKEIGVLSNFNISIAVTDKFMRVLKKNEKYNLVDPRTKKIVKKIKAKKVFDLIVEMAWRNGEPGIIFIDTINKYNPTPKLGKIEATNPCGEAPLLPYESCVLGSINLSKMVKNGEIDYDKLASTVKIGVHFLDNVIDMNKYPLPEIEKISKGNRKIGLGVMGFADMLIKLKIPYNSEKAVKVAGQVMKFINDESKKASVELAKTRGVFPNFKYSVYVKKGPKLRNAVTTTIAPTGTLSIIADCSSGIEPLFALIYLRKTANTLKFVEINSLFKKNIIEEGLYSKTLMSLISERGTIQEIKIIPKRIQQLFVTAHDILPEWHIKIQAAFQKFTDNAVSKTVNLPKNATKKDVAKTFLLAYKLGCKGLTVYREKSRKGQILNICKCKI